MSWRDDLRRLVASHGGGQLAKIIGVHRTTLWRWLHGRATPNAATQALLRLLRQNLGGESVRHVEREHNAAEEEP